MANRAFAATKSVSADQVERRWYVVDAEDQVLGRLATRIATVLRGKHKPSFTPHSDTGDHVIVINADKVALTGRKREQKTYYRHSGYMGGLKSITADKLLASAHSDRVVRSAVRGMLPKNSLGRKMRPRASPRLPEAGGASPCLAAEPTSPRPLASARARSRACASLSAAARSA
jgi:large subunit ribosomal protein L13